MRTIWKQPLQWYETSHALIPVNSFIVHLSVQHEVPTIWYEFDWDERDNKELRTIFMVGTGNAIPDDTVYLGTVHQETFVWHLYEARRAGS